MRHKKRTQNRRKSSGSTGSSSGWAWLLFGVVLGSILGSIGYIKWYEGRPHQVPPMAMQTKKVTKAPKPQFDFYTLLPNAEVEPPRKPGAAPAPKATTPPAVATQAVPIKPGLYRLQLASFKTFNEADAFKAQLALSGFSVEIQSVKLENGTTWYRVQTPPLASQQEALKMQSSLKSQTIHSVVVNTKS